MPIVFAPALNSYYSLPRRPTYPSQNESYWNDIAEEHERKAFLARQRAEEEAQFDGFSNYFSPPHRHHYGYPSAQQQLRDENEARIRAALVDRRRREQEARIHQQQRLEAAAAERARLRQEILREQEERRRRQHILQQRQSQLEEAALLEAWKQILAGAAVEQPVDHAKGKAKENTPPAAPRHVRFFTHTAAEKESNVPATNSDHTQPTSTPETVYYKAAVKIQRFYKSHHEHLRSLRQITSISSQFDTLRSEFQFPSTLDFLPPTTDSTPKLAFTPNNSTLHIYENALTKLLTSLDAVESHGSKSVREARKQVVQRIELELEAVEARKVMLWERESRGAEVEAREEAVVENAVVEKEVDMEKEASVIDPTTDEAVTTPTDMEVEPQEAVIPSQDPIPVPAVIDPSPIADETTEPALEPAMDVVEEPSPQTVTGLETRSTLDELTSSIATVTPTRRRAYSDPIIFHPPTITQVEPDVEFAMVETEPEVDVLESASDSSISSTEAEVEVDGAGDDFEML